MEHLPYAILVRLPWDKPGRTHVVEIPCSQEGLEHNELLAACNIDSSQSQTTIRALRLRATALAVYPVIDNRGKSLFNRRDLVRWGVYEVVVTEEPSPLPDTSPQAEGGQKLSDLLRRRLEIEADCESGAEFPLRRSLPISSPQQHCQESSAGPAPRDRPPDLHGAATYTSHDPGYASSAAPFPPSSPAPPFTPATPAAPRTFVASVPQATQTQLLVYEQAVQTVGDGKCFIDSAIQTDQFIPDAEEDAPAASRIAALENALKGAMEDQRHTAENAAAKSLEHDIALQKANDTIADLKAELARRDEEILKRKADLEQLSEHVAKYSRDDESVSAAGRPPAFEPYVEEEALTTSSEYCGCSQELFTWEGPPKDSSEAKSWKCVSCLKFEALRKCGVFTCTSCRNKMLNVRVCKACWSKTELWKQQRAVVVPAPVVLAPTKDDQSRMKVDQVRSLLLTPSAAISAGAKLSVGVVKARPPVALTSKKGALTTTDKADRLTKIRPVMQPHLLASALLNEAVPEQFSAPSSPASTPRDTPRLRQKREPTIVTDHRH